MPSRLLIVPSPDRENINSIAEFVEIECLRRNDGSVSRLDLARLIEREHETGAGDFLEQITIEVFAEISARSDHCGSETRYPFELADGETLCLLRPLPAMRRTKRFRSAMTYLFLLLATRMNMKEERNQGDEDATVLFEQLSKEVFLRYFGGPADSIDALVFGTSRWADLDNDDEIDSNGFAANVNQLCRRISEGHQFRHRNPGERITARDGKLDVVAWRGFADGRKGKLIGFGQCKTGTHWRNDLTKLRPEGFCDKWMHDSPAVHPVKFYFIADRHLVRWYDDCKDGGILVDRCRIMEYAEDLPIDLSNRIVDWVNAAMASHGLRLP